MAVVTAKFSRSKADARAEIAYYVHRPERDGSQGNRPLFNIDGNLTKEQAYALIREAEKGIKFHKMVISTDPNREDTKRDLNLMNITIQTMLKLQERLQEQIQFMAVQHDNTDVRHVHVLALVKAFVNQDDLQACIDAATQAALFQRVEKDLAQGQQPSLQPTQERAETVHRTTNRSSHRLRRAPQARPAPTGKPCPSCGHTQPKRGLKHTCHCLACGYQLHNHRSLELAQERGLGWELSPT